MMSLYMILLVAAVSLRIVHGIECQVHALDYEVSLGVCVKVLGE